MLIGRTHELRIAGRNPDGTIALADADGARVPLERAADAASLPAEGTVRAFVRTAADGSPVASLALPYVELGRCAALKVVDVGAEGAWLDWGLDKHLLLPFAEQRRPVEPGRIESVLVYLDSSGRLAASSRLDHRLDETPEGFAAWQPVELLVYQRTELGFKAVVDDRATGLLYKDEVFRTVRPGTRTEGWVRRVRPDGRLDLSLQPRVPDVLDGLAERILARLRADGGANELTDRASPEAIREAFGVSKKNHKRALGTLFRKRLVYLEPDRVVLLDGDADAGAAGAGGGTDVGTDGPAHDRGG